MPKRTGIGYIPRRRKLLELLRESRELRASLREAQETLDAIRYGKADAILAHSSAGTEKVFTLKGAEEPYRHLMENLSEGAATLSPEGLILYCNQRLAEMLGMPLERIIGVQARTFIKPDDLPLFDALMERALEARSKSEVELKSMPGDLVPVQLSMVSISLDGLKTVILAATELSEVKALQKQVLETSKQERERLGQDFHDGLGQYLTALLLHAKALEHTLASRNALEAQLAANFHSMLQDAILQSRALARGLFPVELEEHGLMVSIRSLAEGIGRLYGVSCEVEGPESLSLGNQDADYHAFRIVQEAINNAIRHGKAQSIRVALSTESTVGGSGWLRVEDDGTGFMLAETPKGLGLYTMRNRSNLIGGEFSIESRPEGGATVKSTFRIPRSPDAENS